MPNISGNFNTTEEEKKAVTEFLKNMGCDLKQCKIRRHGGENVSNSLIMDEGDIDVLLPDGRTILFEVKNESWYRFKKYGQLGVDFISVFYFKEHCSFRKGVCGPHEYDKFINTVDMENNFKWGKIKYSQSKIWLFYSRENDNGSYRFLTGYDYVKIREERNIEYLSQHCYFAINNKSSNQMSCSDTWNSAVFFVEQDVFKDYIITQKEFAEI